MVKTLVISLSFAAVGLQAYLATMSFMDAFRVHGWERRLYISWGIMRTGVAIMVALITEAVWKAPAIPWTWRVGLYTLGGVATFLGSLGVILEHRWNLGKDVTIR